MPEIANLFNAKFVNVANVISDKLGPPIHDYKQFLGDIGSHSMFLNPCDSAEVSILINKLPNKISAGHDEIPCTIIKAAAPYIIPPLICHIINLMLSQGQYIDDLKIARVTPIFKKGDPLLMDNYRPISLLPTFSKIFERVIFNRLSSFLTTNNILYDSQYGFRKKPFMSTCHIGTGRPGIQAFRV